MKCRSRHRCRRSWLARMRDCAISIPKAVVVVWEFNSGKMACGFGGAAKRPSFYDLKIPSATKHANSKPCHNAVPAQFDLHDGPTTDSLPAWTRSCQGG